MKSSILLILKKIWGQGRFLVYLILFTIWLFWYANVRVFSSSSNIAIDCYQLEPYPVGLVLGARVYDEEKVSPIFSDRLMTAVDLYKSGRIEKIIISGGQGDNGYSEVATGRNFLLDQGIPGDDIFLDQAGFNTYDSVYRAQEIFKASKILIITQRFHLPRALYFAEERDLPALGCVADRNYYEDFNYYENREIFARVKGWLESFIQRKPRYLGEIIDLQGSGKITWDDRVEDWEPEFKELKKDFLTSTLEEVDTEEYFSAENDFKKEDLKNIKD